MSTRRLWVESLECRRMLAGNVRAAVVDGELRISGDGAANWIEVRQIPGTDNSGRTFVVEGKAFNGSFDAGGNPLNDARQRFAAAAAFERNQYERRGPERHRHMRPQAGGLAKPLALGANQAAEDGGYRQAGRYSNDVGYCRYMEKVVHGYPVP